MSRSRISWATGLFTPWIIASAMVMSLTANAGQDFVSGSSLAPIETRAMLAPAQLVPNSALSGNLGGFGSARGLLREARLSVGAREEFRSMPDELSPRIVLKPKSRIFPQIARAKKGDPVVALRPAFESRLKRPGGLKSFITSELMFRADETAVTSSFARFEGPLPGPESVAKFEPWTDDAAPEIAQTPKNSGTPATLSPLQGGSVVTVRPAAVAARNAQGATPRVARAIALGSTTPVSANSRPIEHLVLSGRSPVTVVKAPQPGTSLALRSVASRPDYSALIARDSIESEKKCLAEAVYFESRSEPEEGQAAVAQVILNRVSSGLYPSSVCGVVYQNRARYKACQFSFACEGKSLRITDEDSWQNASRVAEEVLDGRRWLADVGSSTHYHANYVRPDWARRLTKMDAIGRHIFYRLKPGQT